MLAHAQLFISLSRGPIHPKWGHNYLNEFHGGPETLLTWLETQLGLPVANTPQASRISEYAAALDTLSDSSINKSLDADRWATASEILAMRDELRLSGWNEKDSENFQT